MLQGRRGEPERPKVAWWLVVGTGWLLLGKEGLVGDDGNEVGKMVAKKAHVVSFSKKDALGGNRNNSVARFYSGDSRTYLENDGVLGFIVIGGGVIRDEEGANGANKWNISNDVVW